MQLARLLQICTRLDASDLHLVPGQTPIIRCQGQLQRLPGPVWRRAALESVLHALLSPAQRASLQQEQACDFRWQSPDCQARFHLYQQQVGLSAAIRLLPVHIPPLQSLGLPPITATWTDLQDGLILVCGNTGSGKSTTLAALLDRINQQRACHILTLEDPIEYHHACQRALISQREIGLHAPGFSQALRLALRQDPDIIMVGEMRDQPTAQLVLQAAETGHLVFSTLHSRSAIEAIVRLCALFPADAQAAVRAQLAQSLHGILLQQWSEAVPGGKRQLAHEVLLATHAVRHLIRENRLEQIPSLMQAGREQGMHTLQQCLAQANGN